MKHARFFWGVLVFVTLLDVVWWGWLQFLPTHATDLNYWFNAVYGLPFLFASWFLIAHVRAWKRDRATADAVALTYIGLGFGCHGIAQFIWTFYNLVLRVEVPASSIADIFFVASILLQIGGLVILLFHRERENRSVHRFRRSHVALGTLAAFACAYVFVEYLFPSEKGFLFNLNTFYTIVSFLRAFLALLNLYRERHASLRVFLFVYLCGAAALEVADVVYAIRNFNGTYWNGDVSDALYAVGGLLLLFSCWFLSKTPTHAPNAPAAALTLRQRGVFCPLAIVFFGCVVAGQFSQFVFQSSFDALQQESTREVVQMTAGIAQRLAVDRISLHAASALFDGSGTPTEAEFQAFTSRVFSDDKPHAILGFVGPDHVVRFATNLDLATLAAAHEEARRLLDAAPRTHTETTTAPFLIGEKPGMVTVLPVFQRGEYVGSVVMVTLFEQLLESSGLVLADGYRTELIVRNLYVNHDGTAIFDETGRRFLNETGSVEPQPSFVPITASSSLSVQQTFAANRDSWTFALEPETWRARNPYSQTLSVFFSMLILFAALAGVSYVVVASQSRLWQKLAEKTSDLTDKVTELTRSKFFLDNVSDAVVALDEHEVIVYVNTAVKALFGKESDELLYHHAFPHLLSGADVDPVAFRRALAADGTWEGEIRLGDHGSPRFAAVTCTSLQDAELTGSLLIARDVTARKRIEQAKNQFVSLVSHQLRAPMTQLRWMVGQMQSNEHLSKPVAELLASMEGIIVAENKLVGDLLNVSRIERGVLKLNVVDMPVSRLVSETLKPLQTIAREKHVRLHVGVVPKDFLVRVDADKIAEALRNIVDNAVTYAPKEGQVNLFVRATPERFVTIEIHDSGPGIPEELWNELFDIKTAATVNPSAPASAGLGLFLTKKFIDACGGSVSFKTGAKGTSFFVQLPRSVSGVRQKKKEV